LSSVMAQKEKSNNTLAKLFMSRKMDR